MDDIIPVTGKVSKSTLRMLNPLRHTSTQYWQSEWRLIMAIRIGGCRYPPQSFSLSAPSDLEASHPHEICSRWQREASCHRLAAYTWHRLHKSPDMNLCATEVKCLKANGDSVEVWCVLCAAMCLLPYFLKFLGIIHVNRGLHSWNTHILGAGSPWRLNFVR